MKLAAVVFDMDGVLIDSEPFWRQAEVDVLGALGVPLTLDACDQTTGLRIDAAVQHWFDRHPWSGPGIPEVADAIVQRVAASIRSEGRPLPGIMGAVRAVQHSGLYHAIATSSPWPIIDAVLERMDVGSPVICSAADEAAGKPDPAVYLTAARRLGIDPSACLAIEDSANGVASAKAAGMRVIAVQPVDGADWVVPLAELARFLHTEGLLVRTP